MRIEELLCHVDGSYTRFSHDDQGRVREYSVHGEDGKVISSGAYSYDDLGRITVTATENGQATVTQYNEGGLPTRITFGRATTEFTYDSQGRVLRKEGANEVTDLTYDQASGKVARVIKRQKGTDVVVSDSRFLYDGRGNLVQAQDAQGAVVRLTYDSAGRIQKLFSSGSEVAFRYNEKNRPVEIRVSGRGSILIEYTNSGEIKKVESSGGRQAALQVTQVFQQLLDIIRPAGVTLSL
jgi:YD repeat-containing protein